MIGTIGRRAGAAAAAIALAGMAVLGTAPSAQAATTPYPCLNSIEGPGFFDNYGSTVIWPYQPAIRTLSYVDGAKCAGAVASVGISKTDGSRFINVNARIGHDGEIHYMASTHPITLKDTGNWMIRQVAVKQNRITAVRSFTLDDDLRTTHVSRASVLRGGPKETIRPTDPITGYLLAYASTGDLVPLRGQTIVLQARTKGQPYKNILVERNSTHRNGYYLLTGNWAPYRGYEFRLYYPSPYETIAPAWTYLGYVR